MVVSERIKEVVKYSKLSIPKFSKKVGLKTDQAVRELINGRTKTLSDAVQYKIVQAFPEINKEWLVNGVGEMLSAKSVQAGSFSFEASESPGAGFGNEVGIDSSDLAKILNEMRAQREDYMSQLEKKDEQLERRDRQIEELIKLIGK